MSTVQYVLFFLLMTFLSFSAYHSDYPLLSNLLVFLGMYLMVLTTDMFRHHRRSR